MTFGIAEEMSNGACGNRQSMFGPANDAQSELVERKELFAPNAQAKFYPLDHSLHVLERDIYFCTVTTILRRLLYD